VPAAFFSPGAKELAVVGQLNTVAFYDVATAKKVDRWLGTPPVHMNGKDGFLTVAYSSDEKMIVLGGGERIDLRVAGAGAEVYGGHTKSLEAVEVSPDGLTVATSSSDGLRLWEATTGE
jgi:WD40 repeat protein